MKILVRDVDRQLRGVVRLGSDVRPDRVELEPSAGASDGGPASCDLHWSTAMDEQGRLVGCPICRCRELFVVRRAFPQRLGLAVTVVAGLASVALFANHQTVGAYAVLAGVVVVDALIALFTPRGLVCYRCRSEFHQAPMPEPPPSYDLATDEKYNPAWSAASSSRS